MTPFEQFSAIQRFNFEQATEVAESSFKRISESAIKSAQAATSKAKRVAA